MRRAARLAGLASCALLLSGCSAGGLPGGGPTGPDVEAAVQDSADGTFAFTDVDGVAGSSFLIVCPYESADSIDARLGFEWTEAPDHTRSDGEQTVAFIQGGAVVSAVRLSRDEVDFCAGDPWPLLPTDTGLVVSEAAGGLISVPVPGPSGTSTMP